MALVAVLVAWIALAVTFIVMRLRTPATAPSGRVTRSRDGRAVYGFAGQVLGIAIVALWRRPPGAVFVDIGDDPAAVTTAVAVVLAAVAALMAVRAMVALGRVWPVGARMADDVHLVTTGLFGRVRHPIYTAVFLLIVATGLAWSTIEATVVAVWVYGVATHLRTTREEKLLSSALGTGYNAYAARVPRFLPRLWPASPHAVDREAAFVTIYAVIYLVYLFVYQEGALLHWVTLVALPLALLPLVGFYKSLTSAFDSIGVSRAHASRGWLLVIIAGAAALALQWFTGPERADLAQALGGSYGWLLPPAAFALLVCSAATTEEVFFRGLLQTRFANRLHHEWAGWLLASLAFAIYHVPYAYLGAGSTTAGTFRDALGAAALHGLLPGLVIGAVYWRSGRNLLAAIALHALIDLLPAMRVVAAIVHR